MVFKEGHENYLFKSIIKEDNSKEYQFNIDIDNEYLYFHNYKNSLMNKYENYSFNDFKGSEVVSNDYGEVLKIIITEPFKFNLKDNDYRESLKTNLKLVSGIGTKKETKLKESGFNSLDDLAGHESYCDKAHCTLEDIDKLDNSKLIDLVKKNKYTKECNLNLLKSASLFDDNDFKFMDIETLGLSNKPIILVGLAEINNNKITTTQYLIRDICEEPALLKALKSHYDENSVHVTFNGKFFDVPFIKNRLNYYRMSDDILDIPHFDLLHYGRLLWKNKLPNCRLQTIEKNIFSLERKGDVPGKYIPDYYETYLENGNIGPLVPIVEHNRQDVVSLASFLMKMYEEVNGD